MSSSTTFRNGARIVIEGTFHATYPADKGRGWWLQGEDGRLLAHGVLLAGLPYGDPFGRLCDELREVYGR